MYSRQVLQTLWPQLNCHGSLAILVYFPFPQPSLVQKNNRLFWKSCLSLKSSMGQPELPHGSRFTWDPAMLSSSPATILCFLKVV